MCSQFRDFQYTSVIIQIPLRMANTRNISFRISLWWPIHITNPVDKTKLFCNTPHRRDTTVYQSRNCPSYLLPLFQNEASCETIRMEMCSAYRFIFIKNQGNSKVVCSLNCHLLFVFKSLNVNVPHSDQNKKHAIAKVRILSLEI